MKFRKAVKQMQKGYCIRRPHWEYGEYLFMSDKGIIVKFPAGPIPFDISMEIWKQMFQIFSPMIGNVTLISW